MFKAHDTDTIAIRRAGDADAAALRSLAALDSAAIPAGPLLMAEVGGLPRAAISTRTGATIADPFYPSADLLDLLALRASVLRKHEATASGRRGLGMAIRRLGHGSLALTR
jgi:hypothetical protein